MRYPEHRVRGSCVWNWFAFHPTSGLSSWTRSRSSRHHESHLLYYQTRRLQTVDDECCTFIRDFVTWIGHALSSTRQLVFTTCNYQFTKRVHKARSTKATSVWRILNAILFRIIWKNSTILNFYIDSFIIINLTMVKIGDVFFMNYRDEKANL